VTTTAVRRLLTVLPAVRTKTTATRRRKKTKKKRPLLATRKNLRQLKQAKRPRPQPRPRQIHRSQTPTTWLPTGDSHFQISCISCWMLAAPTRTANRRPTVASFLGWGNGPSRFTIQRPFRQPSCPSSSPPALTSPFSAI